jgi:hypothetical protein
MIKAFIILGFFAMGYGSYCPECTEEKSVAALEPGEAYANYKQGMVLDFGQGEEGCGWMLKIDDELYRPKNLDKVYQKDSLDIKVDFELSLSDYQCAEFPEKIKEVYIHWIEKDR